MSEKETNKILHNLSLLHRKDKRVIKEVSFHPLLFFKRKAESGDERAIRIMYWGAYVPKEHGTSKAKAMNYIAETLLKNLDILYELFPVDYHEEMENNIKAALRDKNKPYLDDLYKVYKRREL